ncbi:MAG: hypothetical protein IT495_08115 [Gammaproteobacteria bacterium]|nr:hypothetical protein [Gammaproteobacteria bacterium]
MNIPTVKTLASATATALVLASLGAFAADKAPTCPKGKEWDATKHECVTATKK